MRIVLLLQILIVGLSLIALIRYKRKVILYLPVFLVIFDVIYGFFQSGSGFGTIRNFLLLVLIIYSIVSYKDILFQNFWIPVFLVYCLLLVPLSSNLKLSITDYLCVFVSLFCLPLGFKFIRNIDDLKVLNTAMIWLAGIFIVNSVISSIFGLGIDYYGSSFTMGGFVASKLFSPALFIVLLPIILPLVNSRTRVISIILASLVFIFLLISMRRTSVFIPIFGYLLYFLFSNKKIEFIGLFIVFLLMLTLFFPFYQKVLEQQYKARIETFENPSLENEYRYKETFIILKETFSDTKTILIGKEIFNSGGNYNQGRWNDRPIHIDYNLILHGSGIIGIILYLLIFHVLAVRFLQYKSSLPHEEYFTELVIMFKILFVMIMVVSLNGGIVQVSYRAVILLYLGGILGILNKYYISNQYKHN